MEIFKIPISEQQLDSIPADERLFFIQIGHLANELSTLNRLLLFTSNSTGATELERQIGNSHNLLLLRLCSGKLFEGWQMLKKDYFGSRLSIKYDSLLDESGKASLSEIKRYFSKKNLIKDIRDNFAFHYSSEDLQNQLQDTGTLYFYLAKTHGNSFYSFADVLVGFAMLSKVQGVDPQRAMDTLFADPLRAIKWFQTFISSCMIILGETYLGITWEALGANTIEIPNAKHWKDVQLPLFLLTEED